MDSARSHGPRSDRSASGPVKARRPVSPSLGTKNSFLLDAQKGEESKPQEERGYLAVFFFSLKKKKTFFPKGEKKVQGDSADMSGGSCWTEGRRQTEPRAERKREVRQSAGIWPWKALSPQERCGHRETGPQLLWA